MRLINIDDEGLKKTMAVGGISAKALWKRLQREPTVKAIPIEWIKKYMSKELTNGSLMWCSLDAFLKDWEEENER